MADLDLEPTSSSIAEKQTRLASAGQSIAEKQAATNPKSFTELKQMRAERFAAKHQHNRYHELRAQRPQLRKKYIAEGKMMDPDKKYDLKDAWDMVGECEDMCPEYERHEREFQDNLMEFEKIPGTSKIDHTKAVKRYRRAAADDEKPLPCDVRPPPVLQVQYQVCYHTAHMRISQRPSYDEQRTLDYLFHEIVREHGLRASYGFVRDRTRSIRTDLTLQNVRDMNAVDIHERIARYHLICSHHLCDAEGVDISQEIEQLRKTLQSLMEFYDELRELKISPPNEAEFRAYYILTHAFSEEIQTRMERRLRNAKHVLRHPYMELAFNIRNMLADDDRSLNAYGTLFKTLAASTTPYLFACALHPHFIAIRKDGLRAMDKAYYNLLSNPDGRTPLSDIVELLGYDDENAARVDLEYYDIEMTEVEGTTFVGIGRVLEKVEGGKKKVVAGTFSDNKRVALKPTVQHRLISSKLGPADPADPESAWLELIDGNIPELAASVPSFVPGLAENVPTPSTPTTAGPSTEVPPVSFSFLKTPKTLKPPDLAGLDHPSSTRSFVPPVSISSMIPGYAPQIPFFPLPSHQLVTPAFPHQLQQPPNSLTVGAPPTQLPFPVVPAVSFTRSPSGVDEDLHAFAPSARASTEQAAAATAGAEAAAKAEAEVAEAKAKAAAEAEAEAKAKAAAEAQAAAKAEADAAQAAAAAAAQARLDAERRAKEKAMAAAATEITEDVVMSVINDLQLGILEEVAVELETEQEAKRVAEAQEQARKELVNVAGSEVGLGGWWAGGEGFRSVSARTSGRENVDGVLARIVENIAAVSLPEEPINLAEVVLPCLPRPGLQTGVSPRRHTTTHFKLALSTPLLGSTSNDKHTQWMRALFGGAAKAGVDIVEGTSEIMQRSRAADDDVECWAVVQHVNAAREGELSILAKRIGNKIPLVLVHWSATDTTDNFIQRASEVLMVEYVREAGPIGTIEWVCVDSAADSREWEAQIVRGLKAVVDKAPSEREIGFDGFNDFLLKRLMRHHYEPVVVQVERQFPHRMALHRSRNASAFNVIIENFNDCVKALFDAFSAQENHNIAFPASEFAALPGTVCDNEGGRGNLALDWNDPDRLKGMEGIGNMFLIPRMAEIPNEGTRHAQLEEKGKQLPEDLRPIWTMLYSLVLRTFPNLPVLGAREIHTAVGNIFFRLQEYAAKPTVEALFPFKEISNELIRPILYAVDEFFHADARFGDGGAPYLHACAARLEESIYQSIRDRVARWYSTTVAVWKREEEEEFLEGIDGEDIDVVTVDDEESADGRSRQSSVDGTWLGEGLTPGRRWADKTPSPGKRKFNDGDGEDHLRKNRRTDSLPRPNGALKSQPPVHKSPSPGKRKFGDVGEDEDLRKLRRSDSSPMRNDVLKTPHSIRHRGLKFNSTDDSSPLQLAALASPSSAEPQQTEAHQTEKARLEALLASTSASIEIWEKKAMELESDGPPAWMLEEIGEE
ncbi:hypothetical protein HK104_009343 [Borealophlyctis nickersoniae]|nr:hypothetical protein HK104_009343 [Borealophlyctis nickersoniae]